MDDLFPKRDKDLPVDKLESDPLPPGLEIAEAEYFADMAFDDRLLSLLEIESPTTFIRTNYSTTGTTEGLAYTLFAPNESQLVDVALDDDTIEAIPIPAFSYQMIGSLQLQPSRLDLSATITPDGAKDKAVKIESDRQNPDAFFISKADDIFDINIIDTKALFYLLCQLGGASKTSVDKLCVALAEMKQDKPSVFRANISEIWKQLGESHGESTTVRELTHQVKDPSDPNVPETIKLRREEIERPDSTSIKLYLEHAKDMTDLDIEESHCLRLGFEQKTERNTEKAAERVIVSGASPRLISVDFERKSKGRVKPLDLDAITIKELFVDWFDKLIAD